MRSDRSVSPISYSSDFQISAYQQSLQSKMAIALEKIRRTNLEKSTEIWYYNIQGSSPITDDIRKQIEREYAQLLLTPTKFNEQRAYWAKTLPADDAAAIYLKSAFEQHHNDLIANKKILVTAADIWIMLHVMMSKNVFLAENKWSLELFNLQEATDSDLAMPLFDDKNKNPSIAPSNEKLESWSDRLLLTVGFVGVAIAAVSSVIGAMAYAVLKAVKSFKNVYNNEKVGRSLFRLGAIGAGSVSGTVGGMVGGAMIGSIVPVVGTLIGTIVGGIVGLFLSAGIAAFMAKQITRLVSYLVVKSGFYADDTIINPTNPEKYRLTAAQEHHFEIYLGQQTNTARIFQMMNAVKAAKPKTNLFSDKQTVGLKQDYNLLLKDLKKDPTVHDLGVYIGNKNLFRWAGNHWDHVALEPKIDNSPRLTI